MLRPATDADLDAMLAWRNQPANREVSTYQHEIAPDEHARWWAAVTEDPSRRVMIFTYGDRPLGVVAYFDITDTSAGWGFYLDHDTTAAEGTAMMAWIQVMKDATAYAFDTLGVDVLTGEVNEENEAVRLMNKRFRFTEGEPRTLEDGRVFYPISLRREDRRPTKKDNS